MKKKPKKTKLVHYKCPHCEGKGYNLVSWHIRRVLKRFGRSATIYKGGSYAKKEKE